MTMPISRAKEIIGSYLDYNTSEDVKILGKEHPYEVCECTISDVREAFNLLDEQCNYFKGD